MNDNRGNIEKTSSSKTSESLTRQDVWSFRTSTIYGMFTITRPLT